GGSGNTSAIRLGYNRPILMFSVPDFSRSCIECYLQRPNWKHGFNSIWPLRDSREAQVSMIREPPAIYRDDVYVPICYPTSIQITCKPTLVIADQLLILFL